MRPSPALLAAALAAVLTGAGFTAGLFGGSAGESHAGHAPVAPTPHTLHHAEEGHGHASDTPEAATEEPGKDASPTSTTRATPSAADLARDPPLPPEDGRVPARAEAGELEHQLRSFRIRGDLGFEEMVDRGYVTGSGTLEDPYVLEALRVRGDLEVRDTTKPFILRNSLVEGQLRLSYVGPLAYVHHNRIHDLRVNENLERSESTTSGLFEHNVVAFIGQLRHFSGEFRHNTVGPRPAGIVSEFLSDSGPKSLPEGLVWNFDGYHGALVHNNTVFGRTDVKLHGHYHGDCAVCPAHDHADMAHFPPQNVREAGLEPGSHHSFRHHAMAFVDNTITVDEGVSLRFYDEAHAGDDRTANSEPNRYLEDLHDHHTRLTVARNTFEGGSLALDVLNPDDQRHEGRTSEAVVSLVGNTVTLERPRALVTGAPRPAAAYVIAHATTFEVLAQDNRFAFQESASSMPAGTRWVLEPPAETAGFFVEASHDATLLIERTVGEGATYGVALARTQALDLQLNENRFNAKEEIHHA